MMGKGRMVLIEGILRAPYLTIAAQCVIAAVLGHSAAALHVQCVINAMLALSEERRRHRIGGWGLPLLCFVDGAWCVQPACGYVDASSTLIALVLVESGPANHAYLDETAR